MPFCSNRDCLRKQKTKCTDAVSDCIVPFQASLDSHTLPLPYAPCPAPSPPLPPPPPPPPVPSHIACVQKRMVEQAHNTFIIRQVPFQCPCRAFGYCSTSHLTVSSPCQLLMCAHAGLILVGWATGVYHQDHPDCLCHRGSAPPLPCSAPQSPCCREATPHRPGLQH